jgi:galactokinase
LAKEIEKKFDENLSLAQIVEKYGFEELKTKLNDQNLIQRLTQFYIESYEIIPKVSEHLEKGEIEQIGELIDLSHQNADKYLENQTSETNFLQANARENGAIAASAFGAGFGGSVYALVESEKAEDFMQTWKENYQTKFPQLKSEFFITKAAESKF